NPRAEDTDGDGILDGEEYAAGSNPLDAGSGRALTTNGGCALWNTAVPGQWNVLEQFNPTREGIGVQTVLTDTTGMELNSGEVDLPGYSQFDSLIHEWAGGAVSQGRICTSRTTPA